VRSNTWIVVTVLAGLTAALLHASVTMRWPLSYVLIYLAPLPLFLAGLGFGSVAAAAAATIGGLATGAVMGARAGLFFVLSAGATPVILSYLALINRPVSRGAGEGEARLAGTEWYPEGRLVLWTAGLAGSFLTLIMLLTGPDLETFRAQLKLFATEFTTTITGELSPAERAAVAGLPDLLVLIAPMVGASAWLIFMLANMLLASRILARWGTALRPWASFANLAFPPRAGIVLVALLGACLLPGPIGVIAGVFAAPLATAFAILGLAVIHFLLRNHAARVALLVGLYAALILFSWLVLLPLIAVGLTETGWGLRARTSQGQV
jgi:hypothetical protein